MMSAITWLSEFESQPDKMTCAPNKDLAQLRHPPSLIRVFAVPSKDGQGPEVSSCGQGRLIKWADAQADLRLCWAHR